MSLIWIIVIVLVILWLLGAFGGRLSSSFPKTGNWIHTLIVIADHTHHIEPPSCDMTSHLQRLDRVCQS